MASAKLTRDDFYARGRSLDHATCLLQFHGISYRRDGYRVTSQYSLEHMQWKIEARCVREDGGEHADQCISERIPEEMAADQGYVVKIVFNLLLKLENFMVASEFFVNDRLYRNPYPDKINPDGSWK